MNLRGVSTVIGGFLIHLTLGTIYTIGNMTPYIVSYVRNEAHHPMNYSDAVWLTAMSFFGQGCVMFLGGILERKIGTRFTCLIGGTIFCGSIAITGWLIQYGFVVTVITYGLVSGVGLGLTYIAPLALVMRWYPENKGLVNGIVLSGFGLGALIFNPVQTAFLNPSNEKPGTDGYFNDHGVLERVPRVFYLLGGIYGAMQLLGILLLFQKPKQIGEDTKAINTEANCAAYSSTESKHLKPSQMLRTKEFYMIWLTFALLSQCIMFLTTYYKTFGQQFIFDDRFLSIVGSFASLFNCLGRIVWGRIQDKTFYKLVAGIITLSLTALMWSFIGVPYGGKISFTIWVLASFGFFSGTFSMMPTATALCFGDRHVGTNFGIMFTAPAFSSIFGAVVIQQMLNGVGWLGSFLMIGSFTLIAFVITMFMPRDLKRQHCQDGAVQKSTIASLQTRD